MDNPTRIDYSNLKSFKVTSFKTKARWIYCIRAYLNGNIAFGDGESPEGCRIVNFQGKLIEHPIQNKTIKGIAISSEGHLFAADSSCTVSVFDSNYQLTRTFTHHHTIVGCTIDSQDRFITTDAAFNCSISDSTGKLIHSISTGYGRDEYLLQTPQSVEVNSRDDIIVGDTTNARFVAYDRFGRYLFDQGRNKVTENANAYVLAVTVDRFDQIILADPENRRLCFFESNGNRITTYSNCDPIKGFGINSGLTVDHITDKMIISDQGSTIKIFDPYSN